jgi:hypothetical protein
MGVYIKGMEMPKNCMLCPFCVEEADPANGEMCMVTGKLMPPCNRERLDDCPLVPVPPHGRLIDADALAEHKFVCIPHVSIDGKDAGTAYRLGWNTAIEAVMENAETIIGGE